MNQEMRRLVEKMGQLLLDELGSVPSWWFDLYEWVTLRSKGPRYGL